MLGGGPLEGGDSSAGRRQFADRGVYGDGIACKRFLFDDSCVFDGSVLGMLLVGNKLGGLVSSSAAGLVGGWYISSAISSIKILASRVLCRILSEHNSKSVHRLLILHIFG